MEDPLRQAFNLLFPDPDKMSGAMRQAFWETFVSGAQGVMVAIEEAVRTGDPELVAKVQDTLAAEIERAHVAPEASSRKTH